MKGAHLVRWVLESCLATTVCSCTSSVEYLSILFGESIRAPRHRNAIRKVQTSHFSNRYKQRHGHCAQLPHELRSAICKQLPMCLLVDEEVLTLSSKVTAMHINPSLWFFTTGGGGRAMAPSSSYLLVSCGWRCWWRCTLYCGDNQLTDYVAHHWTCVVNLLVFCCEPLHIIVIDTNKTKCSIPIELCPVWSNYIMPLFLPSYSISA
jgi:hypothetical protein